MSYKSRDENHFYIIVIGVLIILPIIFLTVMTALPSINVASSQPTKKDPESTYTVISSDGTKYSNLTKRFHNNIDFTTEQGKRIVFTGNHTTIEE
jgi:sigma54-dependent transcription regulator